MAVQHRSRLFIEMRLITFLSATISLLSAKPVNRAPACEGHDPAKQLTGFGRVMIGLVPDLQQDVLQNIVGVAFLMHDIADDGFESAAVARMKFVLRF